MFQDKTQTAENGWSFSRAATLVLGASGYLPADELGSTSSVASVLVLSKPVRIQ